jgi:hypothetical protein
VVLWVGSVWLQGLVDSSVSLLSLSMLCRALDNNHLTGTIPSQLAELMGLTHL